MISCGWSPQCKMLNSACRGFKGSIYEGGTRLPAFFHSPVWTSSKPRSSLYIRLLIFFAVLDYLFFWIDLKICRRIIRFKSIDNPAFRLNIKRKTRVHYLNFSYFFYSVRFCKEYFDPITILRTLRMFHLLFIIYGSSNRIFGLEEIDYFIRFILHVITLSEISPALKMSNRKI